MKKSEVQLPEWVVNAGGSARWLAWLESQVKRCGTRARKWARACGVRNVRLPSAPEWRQAIVDAVWESDGRGAYSKFPLSLAPPRLNTNWNWPSVDHLESPRVARVALETRLVNDVKGIMSEPEFESLVAHLAYVMRVAPRRQLDWACGRSFAKPEQPLEPPLEGR